MAELEALARLMRGRTVIAPDDLAIIAILGENLLKQNGLLPTRDYRLLRTPSHNNALLTLHRLGADAALVGSGILKQLPPEVAQKLRILSRTPSLPNLMAMTPPRLAAAETARLQSAVLAFSRDGAGQKFFAATNFGDMQPITDTDMARLRPFLKNTRERLQ